MAGELEQIEKLIEEQGRAFEEFKQANDRRLDDIAKKGKSDPLLEEKVDKINTAISTVEKSIADIEKKMNRPDFSIPGHSVTNPDQEEHKSAFIRFMKKGNIDGLDDLQAKALNVTIGSDGGYAVPVSFDSAILEMLRNMSPMRQVCRVIPVSGEGYKKLVNLGGTASGWVGEQEARTETTGPSIAVISPYFGEIYANPAASQTFLDDVFFNAESWLAGEVNKEFAEEEGAAFTTGTGIKKPKGFTTYTSATTADSTRAFGVLQHTVTSGATAMTFDNLIDLFHSLKAGYRANATFMFNSQTLGYIRKIKNATTGDYIWQPNMTAGNAATILGKPYVENEDMADMTTGEISAAFADWKRAYVIFDVMGTRVLRDPYTNKPFVHFYTTKRVGGYVEDSTAIKLLKQA